MLASERKAAIDKYIEYMQQEEEKDYDSMKVVGDEAYQMLCSSKRQAEERKRLDEILVDQGMSQEQYELIKSGSRRRDLIEYKVNYAREAARLKYTHIEIGKNINISDAAVRKLIKRAK
ncbi:MAG: hypothetical protein K0R84_658 [Clostridia bacterium]|jgi:hypothetical protein|nr:hypothetical protein [Clostridia bacterium]